MPDETPAGYSPAGDVTVILRFSSVPYSVRGPVLRHEACGDLVAPSAVEAHERLSHPGPDRRLPRLEAGEAG